MFPSQTLSVDKTAVLKLFSSVDELASLGPDLTAEQLFEKRQFLGPIAGDIVLLLLKGRARDSCFQLKEAKEKDFGVSFSYHPSILSLGCDFRTGSIHKTKDCLCVSNRLVDEEVVRTIPPKKSCVQISIGDIDIVDRLVLVLCEALSLTPGPEFFSNPEQKNKLESEARRFQDDILSLRDVLDKTIEFNRNLNDTKSCPKTFDGFAVSGNGTLQFRPDPGVQYRDADGQFVVKSLEKHPDQERCFFLASAKVQLVPDKDTNQCSIRLDLTTYRTIVSSREARECLEKLMS